MCVTPIVRMFRILEKRNFTNVCLARGYDSNRFFIQTEEGKKFLHRLSQHPYENIEHFTANSTFTIRLWRYGDVGKSPSLLQAVLSRVHKNRSVKEKC